MPRMGADGYSSAGTTQLSAKVNEDLKRDFRDACDNLEITMTDAIEGFMEEFVEEHGPAHIGRSEGYYPDDPTRRDRYETCLEHATHDLRIYQQRHARAIAQDCRRPPRVTSATRPIPSGGRGISHSAGCPSI